MKLEKITGWLDRMLDLSAFDDVSNNGLQIARRDGDVTLVAFSVDGSAKSIRAAAEAGAQLLVSHHGISWGGGIRRIVGGEYEVVKAAMDANVALYAAHLPLDANKSVGNNWELARYFGLERIEPAFSYHGNVIGVTGFNKHGKKIGVCSGGAGEFAPAAKALGCDLYVTGEANWGEKVAAENIGMRMICAGHYETETFGVKALAKKMARCLKIKTVFVSLVMTLAFFATTAFADVSADEYECGLDRFYAGAAGTFVLPQGSSRMSRHLGAAFRFGCYLTESWALDGEASWITSNRVGLSAKALWHWWGYERFDPFFTFGAKGWMVRGQVGPNGGIGAFYHMTECLSLRFDADATLGVETRTEMVYSLSAGFQWSF